MIVKDGHPVKHQPQTKTFTKEKVIEKENSFSKRILIVDDESDITLTFKSALEKKTII